MQPKLPKVYIFQSAEFTNVHCLYSISFPHFFTPNRVNSEKQTEHRVNKFFCFHSKEIHLFMYGSPCRRKSKSPYACFFLSKLVITSHTIPVVAIGNIIWMAKNLRKRPKKLATNLPNYTQHVCRHTSSVG